MAPSAATRSYAAPLRIDTYQTIRLGKQRCSAAPARSVSESADLLPRPNADRRPGPKVRMLARDGETAQNQSLALSSLLSPIHRLTHGLFLQILGPWL